MYPEYLIELKEFAKSYNRWMRRATALTEIDTQLFKYKKEECIENKNISPAIVEKFENNGYSYWLNIHGINEPEIIASICNNKGIHYLVIQGL